MATWKMAVVGLESRDLALLETAIDLASGLETGRWELVDDQEAAQVILVNLDVSAGEESAENYGTNQLMVQYSASDAIDHSDGITLSPPLSYRNVTNLLKKLELELAKTDRKSQRIDQVAKADKKTTTSKAHSETVIEQLNPADIVKHKIDWLSDEVDESPILTEITSPPADLVSTKTTDQKSPFAETFIADSRLLGIVLNTIENGHTTLISHKNYPELKIFPDNGWFVFSEELDSHPEMFREAADSFSIEILENEIKDELFSGRLPQSLWKLLFTAALFGSEGRLLKDLDSEKPFHLVHTPYFGMIPHTADHISISEYMVNNNVTIDTISNDTNIDIETVIDFCNACDAIQLLQNDDTIKAESNKFDTEPADITALENDTTIESEIDRDATRTEKSGLINSLWSNLTKPS